MTFSDISKIRQGGDIWCSYLQKFILNMDLICVLVVLVMITINNLQSLIMLDVNLGVINMFSNLRQGGDNQNIELKLALYIMGVYDIQK